MEKPVIATSIDAWPSQVLVPATVDSSIIAAEQQLREMHPPQDEDESQQDVPELDELVEDVAKLVVEDEEDIVGGSDVLAKLLRNCYRMEKVCTRLPTSHIMRQQILLRRAILATLPRTFLLQQKLRLWRRKR